jgi:hypothetical protein
MAAPHQSAFEIVDGKTQSERRKMLLLSRASPPVVVAEVTLARTEGPRGGGGPRSPRQAQAHPQQQRPLSPGHPSRGGGHGFGRGDDGGGRDFQAPVLLITVFGSKPGGVRKWPMRSLLSRGCRAVPAQATSGNGSRRRFLLPT